MGTMLRRRLAWAMVAGVGSWCAEAAAQQLFVERGLPSQRAVFRQLDAWLHAGPHSTRPHYAALLNRVKVTFLLRFSTAHATCFVVMCTRLERKLRASAQHLTTHAAPPEPRQ